jgi:SAM-dependent methyltransferase
LAGLGYAGSPIVTNIKAEIKPDYGVDAPNVLRNFFLFGVPCLLLGIFGPHQVHLGKVGFFPKPMFFFTGLCLVLEGLLFLLYVKFGKFRHRDFMLSLHQWRGDEQVLDVGCGRGLLLAGAAKRLATLAGSGRATGIDIWSNDDMGSNSEAATRHNLEIERISDRCTLLGVPAQEMSFPDATFDVVTSNLCLHNIYDRQTRRRALEQIARVLKPGGIAVLSDYKLTSEYADRLRQAGFAVERRWGNPLYTFPPLRVVIARKSRLSAPLSDDPPPREVVA